jgi:hypothetical protein
MHVPIHRQCRHIRRQFLRIIWLGVLSLVGCFLASAQQQWEIDHTLDMLAGDWTGTAQIAGETRYCEQTCEWILGNAYLSTTLKIYRDPVRKTATFIEEREFLKPSGEARYSVNRFSNESVSAWGACDVSGKSWKSVLKNSDGGEEHVALTWLTGTTIEITGRIFEPGSDQPARSYVLRLKKRE